MKAQLPQKNILNNKNTYLLKKFPMVNKSNQLNNKMETRYPFTAQNSNRNNNKIELRLPLTAQNV